MPLINTRIMSHPLNWAIVVLMVVIAGIAGHTIMSYFDREPASNPKLPDGLTTEQFVPANSAQFGAEQMASLATAQ